MSDKCEMLENYGFFREYGQHSVVVRRCWIVRFCDDQARSECCARKKSRRETGELPPDNMSPTGKML